MSNEQDRTSPKCSETAFGRDAMTWRDLACIRGDRIDELNQDLGAHREMTHKLLTTVWIQNGTAILAFLAGIGITKAGCL